MKGRRGRQTERQNERQEGKQNERQTGKQGQRQEGKRGLELRRWVQRGTARFTARGDGRESAPHWNGRSLRRPTALSLRRSVIPRGFARLFWTVPQRFPASGQPHKQFRSTSDAVQLRFPSEDPMNIREHRTAAGIYDCRQLKTAPASLTGARRRRLCGTGTDAACAEREETTLVRDGKRVRGEQKNKPGSHRMMTAWFLI